MLGLFDSEAKARSWLTTRGVWRATDRVATIASDDDLWKRNARMRRGDLWQPRKVVRISAGPPAAAYSPADLKTAEDKGVSFDTLLATPLCRIPPGTAFVVTHPQMMDRYYEFAPVQCGVRPAFVHWRDTLLDATIAPAQDGTFHLFQVTSVACDSASFGEWLYDDAGRHVIPGLEPVTGPHRCRS